MAIKPEGGGVYALMARPLRQELFFAASLKNYVFNHKDETNSDF